ncbi:hypothetical protein [Lactobacillus sp. PSON]|uniref:hypothetical protein n=1 Tax=Lactobacillus sp. PSON TaxID=3455454 RepID=UPI004043020E
MYENALNKINVTSKDKFEAIGYFSNSSNKEKILQGYVGTLKCENGVVTITIVLKGNEELDLNKPNIYGFLNKNIFIRLNDYIEKAEDNGNPDFRTVTLLSFNSDFSQNQFSSNQKYKSVVVNMEETNILGRILYPELKTIEDSDYKEILLGKTDEISIYICPELHQIKNRTELLVNRNLGIRLLFNVKQNINEIRKYIKVFQQFISLISNQSANILSVLYLDDTGNNYVNIEKIMSKAAVEGLITSSFFNFAILKDSFPSIIRKLYIDDKKLENLKRSYLVNIESNKIDINSVLVNLVNSIDFYMAGETYSNGNKIQNLISKFEFWFAKLPSEIQSEFNMFIDNDKLSLYFQCLIDTRDYYVHNVKENSDYLLKTISEKEVAVKFLKHLIYNFILYKLDVPIESIVAYDRIFLSNVHISAIE